MTVLCAHPGCQRPNPMGKTLVIKDQYCTRHDGSTEHGQLVCLCAIAQPTPGWGNECAHCGCPIVALNPTLTPYHHTYPQLATQTVTRPGTEQVA